MDQNRTPDKPSPNRIVAPLVCAVLGTEIMFALFLLLGRKTPAAEVVEGLTALGKRWYQPERELLIYLVATVFTVALALLLRRMSTARESRAADERRAWGALGFYACAGALVLTFVLVCGLAAKFVNTGRLTRGVAAVALAVPILLLATTVLVALKRGVVAHRASLPADVVIRPQSKSWRLSIDIAICVALSLLIFIPDTTAVAGLSFVTERFHHWDFYAMGPTLGYLRGDALGTEVYTQYGVGWPLVFAAVAGVRGAITYGALIKLATLYCCLYFVGVYAFLRRLLGSVLSSVAGTLIVLNIALFTGLPKVTKYHPTIWQWPSSSVLRSAFDIWFFIALLAHARSRRIGWLATAGALVGLAVLFGTDTGIYLALAFAIYLLASMPNRWRNTAIAATFGGGVLLSGLAIASRGTLFSVAFIRGWLEVFRLYPSGMSMLPVFPTEPGVPLGALFAAMVVATYLFVICGFIFRRHEARTDSSEGLVLCCLAVYGLCYLVQYVGRSHVANLSHVSVPFALLVIAGAWQCRDFLRFHPRTIVRIVPLLVAGVLLLLNPNFRRYPNVLHHLARGEPADLFPLLPSSGVRIPKKLNPMADQYRSAIAALASLHAAGKDVAIISNDDVCFYVYSRAEPSGRYLPLVSTLLTKAQLAEAIDELCMRRPDAIFIAEPTAAHEFSRKTPTDDSIEQFRLAAIRWGYRLDGHSGFFEVWRRPD